MALEPDAALNILGDTLIPCSLDPLTGFYRDGCCNTCAEDLGSHTVCAEMTEEFLAFTRYLGNDLSTPRPEWNFPGLKPGDNWCVCAGRWLEAHENDAAPRVFLRRTHRRALDIVPLELLQQYACDTDTN